MFFHKESERCYLSDAEHKGKRLPRLLSRLFIHAGIFAALVMLAACTVYTYDDQDPPKNTIEAKLVATATAQVATATAQKKYDADPDHNIDVGDMTVVWADSITTNERKRIVPFFKYLVFFENIGADEWVWLGSGVAVIDDKDFKVCTAWHVFSKTDPQQDIVERNIMFLPASLRGDFTSVSNYEVTGVVELQNMDMACFSAPKGMVLDGLPLKNEIEIKVGQKIVIAGFPGIFQKGVNNTTISAHPVHVIQAEVTKTQINDPISSEVDTHTQYVGYGPYRVKRLTVFFQEQDGIPVGGISGSPVFIIHQDGSVQFVGVLTHSVTEDRAGETILKGAIIVQIHRVEP